MLTDRLILVFTLVIAVVYLYASTQIPTLEIGDPLGPKAFPRLLGIGLLLAAAMFGYELWRDRRKRDEAPVPFEKHVLATLGVVAVWTGLYYLVFDRLGYILATLVYLLPMMAWFNRGKWMANILSTILFVALTYYLFVKLEVRLPQGLLTFL